MSLAELPIETDTGAAARDKLRLALDALHEDQARLAQLDQARWRSHDQWLTTHGQVTEAETALAAAQRDERERIISDYVSETRTPSLTKAAANTLEAAQANLRKFSEIEQALVAEIDSVTHRIARRQSAVHAALAAVVTASEGFHRLFDQMGRCWAELRGLRKTFNHLHNVSNGHIPQEFISRWQRVESLAFDLRGVAIDNTPFTAWSEALAKLLDDPDNAELPP